MPIRCVSVAIATEWVESLFYWLFRLLNREKGPRGFDKKIEFEVNLIEYKSPNVS